MYGGKVVENGNVDAIETRPRHPYTRLLKACVPRIDGPVGLLTAIEGAPPPLGHMPQGCPFAPRCPVNLKACWETMPPLAPDQSRLLACWNPQ
jgi:oligopeptide/dipeptide ABC transporter ATP-binding protein